MVVGVSVLSPVPVVSLGVLFRFHLPDQMNSPRFSRKRAKAAAEKLQNTCKCGFVSWDCSILQDMWRKVASGRFPDDDFTGGEHGLFTISSSGC